jgi:lipid II:glycine glycyltransferase (peptidoglycan interpeptide bridge formation enzyme)
MTRDVNGLEIPPRTRWKGKYKLLLNESLRVKQDLKETQEELEKARNEIARLKMKIRILNKSLRSGQSSLPLQGAA